MASGLRRRVGLSDVSGEHARGTFHSPFGGSRFVELNASVRGERECRFALHHKCHQNGQMVQQTYDRLSDESLEGCEKDARY